MNKRLIIIILFLLFILLSIFFKSNNSKEDFRICVEGILTENSISTVTLTQNKTRFILSGELALGEKVFLLQKIKMKCSKIAKIELNDEISTFLDKHPAQAWLDFMIDNVNSIVELHGVLPSQLEISRIKKIFKKKFPNKKIQQDLSTNYALKKTMIVENTSLILSHLEEIQRIKVNLTEDKLVFTGLARDNFRAQKLITKLHEIFDDKLEVDAHIDAVINHQLEFNKVEIEQLPLPKIEQNN